MSFHAHPRTGRYSGQTTKVTLIVTLAVACSGTLTACAVTHSETTPVQSTHSDNTTTLHDFAIGFTGLVNRMQAEVTAGERAEFSYDSSELKTLTPTTTAALNALLSPASRQALRDAAAYEKLMHKAPKDVPEHKVTQVNSRLRKVNAQHNKDNQIKFAIHLATKRDYTLQPEGNQWTEESIFVGTFDPTQQRLINLNWLSEDEVRERRSELTALDNATTIHIAPPQTPTPTRRH